MKKVVAAITVILFLASMLSIAFNAIQVKAQGPYTVTVKAEDEASPPNPLAVPIYWENATLDGTSTTEFPLIGQSGELNLTAPLTHSVGSTLYVFDHWSNNTADYPTGQSAIINFAVSETTTMTAHYKRVPSLVTIDIKPGSYPNSINPKSKGVLPVAILGNETFDVKTVNASTVRLGNETFGVPLATRGSKKAPKLAYSYEDINGDGYLDMVMFFRVQDLAKAGLLARGTTQLTLTGALNDGTPITGTDSVRIVPPQKT